MHWPVPRAALQPLVPPPQVIDDFAGTAYIGLVAFNVEAARPVGAPPGWGLRFLETNVRTYVRNSHGDPGVYFFSLDASSLAATVGARLSFGLPYFWARGRQHRTDVAIEYALRRRVGRRPGCQLSYTVGQSPGVATPGTLEHFLIERYVLYVRRGPSLWSVRVAHPPYPLVLAQLSAIHDQLVEAAGVATRGAPPLVHFSAGVDVTVYAPHVALRV
jgi:uncharacterized protein YqjF (DUF2071 family)